MTLYDYKKINNVILHPKPLKPFVALKPTPKVEALIFPCLQG